MILDAPTMDPAGIVAEAATAAAMPAAIVTVEPGSGGGAVVVVAFLNTGATATAHAAPRRLAATATARGETRSITLELTAPTTSVITPGGFETARYAWVSSGPAGDAVVALAGTSGGVTIASGGTPAVVPATASGLAATTFASPAPDPGNAFLGNLSAYAPIYAVYGPGSGSAALLQISFKYQLLGRPGGDRRWFEGIHFGYTQRLYWDVGARSSPFRNVDYQPELFYLLGERALTGRATFDMQAGVAHESNGRGGPDSRSLNRLYLHPTVTAPVGRYRLTIGPELWAFVGSVSDNPDIARYRGHLGLAATIGRDDGLRLRSVSRMDVASGRGATSLEASYPLNRLIAPDLNLYVFGQAFAGYGENLLDYDRRATRLRVGLGIVR